MLPRSPSSRRRFEQIQAEIRAARRDQRDEQGRSTRIRERSATELVRQFLRILGRHRRRLALILAVLTLATSLGLVPPAATKFLVDYVLSGTPLPDSLASFVPRSRGALLLTLAITVVVVSVIRTSLALASRWQATRLARRVQLSVRRQVFAHVLRLPLSRVQSMKAGGAASLLRQDAGSVGELVFGMFYNPWQAAVQLLGSLAILAWVDLRLLLGSLALVPLVYVTHSAWIARIRPQHRRSRKLREEADAMATESFAGTRIVRAFSGQRSETARIVRANHLLGRQELRSWWWQRSIELLWDLLLPLASAALMLFGGQAVLRGELSLGDLMMFLAYLLMLLGPLAVLAQSAAQFQDSLSGLDRVLDLLAEPLELEPHRGTIEINASTLRGEIEFEKVSFRYEGTDRDVLHEVSFHVPAGSTVALVGPSGAGKTTLCNLVARFHDPTSGRILIDGLDLATLEVERYRRAIGIVEQDVFLFDGTVAENVAYANRRASEAAIRQALQVAHAEEFVERLPQGLGTRIGERGVKLSGGQRQRLAIARAILANPRILILDEATANLDTESERAIQAALETLLQERTCLVIAHRLSTIASADLILVVDEGQVVERGSHAELMERDGRYRQMVLLQTATSKTSAGDANLPPEPGRSGPSLSRSS